MSIRPASVRAVASVLKFPLATAVSIISLANTEVAKSRDNTYTMKVLFIFRSLKLKFLGEVSHRMIFKIIDKYHKNLSE